MLPLASNEKLTYEDLVWLYGATADAFAQVKDIKRKTPAEVDGEVFTVMRRIANETGSPAIKQLFRTTMKQFSYRLDSRLGNKEKEIVAAMYDKLRRHRLAEAPLSSEVRDLEVALLAAQASVREAARIAGESEKVRKDLDAIQDILDGKEEARP